MTSNFDTTVAEVNSLSKPLQGYIGYQTKKDTYHYGIWYKNTYVLNKKVLHDTMYLGKVLNKDQGIFFKQGYGIFRFTLEKGFGEPLKLISEPLISPDSMMDTGPSNIHGPKECSLNFGDVWMIDQVSKQIGLDKVMEDLLPDSADTLKALVAYRLIENDHSYLYASDWFDKSYASKLYPQAKLDSPRISDFHKMLGQDVIYRRFFKSYLKNVINCGSVDNQISLPILIYSTGLPNSNKSELTATNCHHGKVSHEIRLIYVVDKNSKLPIYFKFISGNIVDNTTLTNTINTLNAYNIDVKMAIMDAGYYTDANLEQLILNEIPFVTRMPPHRSLYKKLILKHGETLSKVPNGLMYQGRGLCGKKESVTLFDKELFAYVMYDVNKAAKEQTGAISKYVDDKDQVDCYSKEYDSAGQYIILSSIDCSINEIMPLYYTRQLIEQLFDVSKTYAGLLPLRGHSTEAIKGIVLISFIATIIYSSINYKLSKSKYSALAALIKLGYVGIDIYKAVNILDVLTKEQKDLFVDLNLESPYMLEKGNLLERDPLLSSIKSKNVKRGRPKGRKNKINELQNQFSAEFESTHKKGRPKGSKNKVIKEQIANITPNMKDKRQICVDKVLKTIDNTDKQINSTLDPKGLRKRGRPKGSKNKVK
jgi:hypothetical protein